MEVRFKEVYLSRDGFLLSAKEYGSLIEREAEELGISVEEAYASESDYSPMVQCVICGEIVGMDEPHDWDHEGATLEEVFASLQWERKFEYVRPPRGAVKVFREGQAAEALEYFSSHEEETDEVVRSVYLFSVSLGQVLAVDEERWEDMDQ